MMHAWPLGAALLFAAGISCVDANDVARPLAPAAAYEIRQATTTLPNIVIIKTDDQRADLAFDYMPLTRARLADSGVVFRKYFAASPLCCPERTSFLTGLDNHATGVFGNQAPLGGATKFLDGATLATELRAAGYVTGLIGKYLNEYNLKTPWPYVPPGWDEWRAFGTTGAKYYGYSLVEKAFDSSAVHQVSYGTATVDYSTNRIKTKANAFIIRAPSDKPIFLMLTPFAPHYLSGGSVLPTPAPNDAAACGQYAFPILPSVNEADVTDKPVWLAPLASHSVAEVATDWRAICRTLQAVDRLVNAVVSTLASVGRLNTLLIYTSDNGYSLGEHRIWRQKANPYDESARLPLAIRWPGGVRGAVDTNTVGSIDLTATVRAVAGLALQGWGLSILPLLAIPNAPWPDGVLIEQYEFQRQPARVFTALRTHRWLYVEAPAGGPGGGPWTELYDLAVDPYQMQSVAADSAGTATRATLATRLATLRAR